MHGLPNSPVGVAPGRNSTAVHQEGFTGTKDSAPLLQPHFWHLTLAKMSSTLLFLLGNFLGKQWSSVLGSKHRLHRSGELWQSPLLYKRWDPNRYGNGRHLRNSWNSVRLNANRTLAQIRPPTQHPSYTCGSHPTWLTPNRGLLSMGLVTTKGWGNGLC